MNNCNLVHGNLFAYTEGDLPDATRELFDTHIAECAECAGVLLQFKSAMNLIDDQKKVGIKPFAETRILQGIETKLEKRNSINIPIYRRVLQPALISFGLVISVSVGILIGYEGVKSVQYREMLETESVRADLNMPDMIYEEPFNFTD